MIDKKIFFDNFPYRPISEQAVKTVENIIDFFMEDEGFTYLTELAYILATAYHETAHTFDPGIEEYGKGKGRSYGIPDETTGKIYYGRGLCQLTWKRNYQKFSELLDQPLVTHPELALDPVNSVKIMMIGMKDGLFTGNRLRMYLNANRTDFENARRVVNGTDKSKLIATYARNFFKALETAKIPEV